MAGQLIERGKGRWLVRIFLGRDEEGKRRYHNKTIHGRKKDAQAYLTRELRKKDIGQFSEPSRDFLGPFLRGWLETAVKPRVRETTFKSYQQQIRVHILPRLGNVRLSNLTPAEIQKAYNDMGEEVSPRTIRYVHSVLKNALDQAVKWKKVTQNPAEYVDLPRQQRKEIRVLSTIEVKRFLQEANSSRFYVFFSLLVSTGIRPGEARGLKWDDIDFENARLKIRRSMSVNGKLEEPKTASSKRSIPLSNRVIEELKDHRDLQDKEKSIEGRYEDNNLVFANQIGGPIHYRNLIRRYFKPTLKKAGLPENIRLYDLRHTCATLLLSDGENIKVVSERLGHSNISLTLNTYTHVLPNMQEKATKRMEKLLF